jgi:hypothetical protein
MLRGLARRARGVGLLLLAGWLVTGCGAPAPSRAGPTLQPSVSPIGSLTVTQAATAPVRTELEASDPTTVSLANGRPTLVEFFAFW